MFLRGEAVRGLCWVSPIIRNPGRQMARGAREIGTATRRACAGGLPMNHERVPASYWLHAHGSSKASTAWRDVGWQTRQKNAHALSHSGRKGGVRRRETVGVGHAGGRARARHIYRAAAHGHAAHIAHTRSLRPDAPVSCHRRGGAGGGTQLPRARAAGRWGASLARGVAYAARACHPCIWSAPDTPMRRSRG